MRPKIAIIRKLFISIQFAFQQGKIFKNIDLRPFFGLFALIQGQFHPGLWRIGPVHTKLRFGVPKKLPRALKQFDQRGSHLSCS
jgi:hypothetical protein